jgi:hypothetical protein
LLSERLQLLLFTLRRVALVRDLVAAVLIAAFVLTSVAPSFAAGGQSGNLQGVIIDGATKNPIPNVEVKAVSPTGSYTTKTDARGTFQIIGMNIDTYVVSFTGTGYQSFSLTGVNIQGDQTTNLGSESLSKSLTTIGRVVGRSASSVFQPSQTTDSYTITGERILQTMGKAAATDETQLALAVPGVSLTDSGAITIRGGLRTEVGYQLDGVPFTEPFFAENAGNNLFNGIGSLQVVEGAGDATQSDVGSGVFNLIPKRGTYPGFGYVDAEIGSPNLRNQLAGEWGVATKSGNISNYIAFTGYNASPYYGYRNADAGSYGNFYGISREKSQQFLDNFVFKFGKDLNQSIQVLYVNSDLEDYGNYGGYGSIAPYYPNSPYNQVADLWNSLGGDYQNQVQLNPGVPTDRNATPTQPEEIAENPTRFLKIEYDNNLDAATFLRLRYWNWETEQYGQSNTGNNNLYGFGIGAMYISDNTGGPRVGGSLDLQHQFGPDLTVSLEGTYETSHPIWNDYNPNEMMFFLSAAQLGIYGTPGATEADFLPGGYLSTVMCGAALCFPNGVPAVPSAGINYNGAWYQQYGAGVRVQYNLKKLKLDLGVRKDYQIQNYGINPYNPGFANNPSDVDPANITDTYLKPSALQPRGAIAYQFGNDDAVRASYGRSVVFLTAQTAGTPASINGAGPFLNVPAQPGSQCGSGITALLPCKNYAQELYWLYDQNGDAPDLGGALPSIYNNYDFSYQHQFGGGYALKITPFYKQGVDLASFALVRSLASGSFVFTVNNQGINKTSGVELGLNTPDRTVGFSGFLSATYQNVIASNPPLGGGEDSLPVNGSGSLILGDTYRAGYISPVVVRVGGDYKFKNGLRIGPTLQFNNGFPYSIGSTIPSSCAVTPDGNFANITQVNFGCGVTYVGGFEGQSGTNISTQYYDPAYSGNNLNPNVAATRGTPSTSSSGGNLWHPNLQANLTLEYKINHNVFGVQISNLFGNWYNGLTPSPNPYYQPVADGQSGALTGTNPYAGIPGFVNLPRDTYAFTNGAYIYVPGTGSTPGNVLNFYYQYQF